MSQSNFQDTFTKNQNESNLQYDDSAFYFFSTAVLTIMVIPLIISIYRSYRLKKSLNVKMEKLCSCHGCKSKIPQLIRMRKHPSSFYLKIFLLVLIGYTLSFCAQKAASSKGFKTFDPYEILDLLPTATKKEIKTQYRKLARKVHPDNNPGDPDASQKFILLNKAYSCLTDENAMASCEKFGSPDGPSGTFQVGIALPSFLLKKENKLVILALFFILLLIILPATVFYFYQSSEELDEYGTNKEFIFLAIEILKNENVLYKNFIEIISLTQEVKPFLGAKPEQIPALEKIRDPQFVPKFGLQKFKPYLKPFYLLNAYMNGKPIAPVLQDDLNEIIKGAVKVLNSMIDFSVQLYTDQRSATYLLGKPLSLQVVERLINFSQSFYQGLWVNESSLLQLPYFTRDNLASIQRKLKKIDSLRQLRECDDLKAKLIDVFEKDNSAAVDEILYANETISNLVIEPEVFVELEEVKDNIVFVGDIFTIKINVKRLNRPTFAHSKTFPFMKRESLLLLVLDPNSKGILHYKRFTDIESVVSEEIKDAARFPGEFKFKIIVKSDCYLDVDVEMDYSLVVMPGKRAQLDSSYIHPDDEKALKENSFMGSLMKEVAGKEVDSDEELEDGEEADDKKTDDLKEEEYEDEPATDEIKEVKTHK